MVGPARASARRSRILTPPQCSSVLYRSVQSTAPDVGTSVPLLPPKAASTTGHFGFAGGGSSSHAGGSRSFIGLFERHSSSAAV